MSQIIADKLLSALFLIPNHSFISIWPCKNPTLILYKCTNKSLSNLSCDLHYPRANRSIAPANMSCHNIIICVPRSPRVNNQTKGASIMAYIVNISKIWNILCVPPCIIAWIMNGCWSQYQAPMKWITTQVIILQVIIIDMVVSLINNLTSKRMWLRHLNKAGSTD